MSRGRHAAGSGTFRRDVVITIIGIITVAVLVFGGLWLFARLGEGDRTADTTAASVGTTTSVSTAPTATTLAEAPADTGTSETTTAESSPPTIAVRPPSDITVQVLNSVGTTGLAAQATALLEDAGYQVVEPDNYDPLLERSLVLFRDGFGPEAFELAALFPDAQVGQSDDLEPGVDVLVLLGSSYVPE